VPAGADVEVGGPEPGFGFTIDGERAEGRVGSVTGSEKRERVWRI
jgi:hypothetical protein